MLNTRTGRWLRKSVLTTVVLAMFGLSARAVEVANLAVQQPPTGLVLLRYDLFGGGQFDVELLVSLDDGETFQYHPEALIRDIGSGILPGQGKEIIWFPQAEKPDFVAADHVFRVIAWKEDSLNVDAVETHHIDWRGTDSTITFTVAPLTLEELRDLMLRAGVPKRNLPGAAPTSSSPEATAAMGTEPTGEAAAEQQAFAQPTDWRLVRQQAIRQMVTSEDSALQACYEEYRDRNLELKGQVRIRFTVRPDGYVENVEFVEHEWNDMYNGEKVEACLQTRIEGWRFPPAPSKISTEFKLDFLSITKPQYKR